MDSKFIDNYQCSLIDEVESLLEDASEAWFAVAFIRITGVRLIAPALEAAVRRGARVRVLFGRDWALSQADAVRTLLRIGTDVKCYSGVETFHPKAYIFRKGLVTTAIVGSSNLSRSGLTSGCEWNVRVVSQEADPIRRGFDRLWYSAKAELLTDKVLARLEGYKPPANFAEVLGANEDRQPPSKGRRRSATLSGRTEFLFTVNKSFRKEPGHPVTVPRRQVSYEDLRWQGIAKGPLIVQCVGPLLEGRLNQSKTNGHEYYQITLRGPDNHPLFELPLGSKVLVRLGHSRGRSRVVFAPSVANQQPDTPPTRALR